jgi:HEAT repeat protein
MQKTVNATHGGDRADVVTALCALLGEGDEVDRCFACRALGVIGATEAVPALVERLRDEDIDVCVDAATALGVLGSHAAVDPLNESLRGDPDGEVKIAVVESLARIGGPRTVSVLMEIAERRPAEMNIDGFGDWDPWWDMQREAVLALGRARVAEAVPVLARLLDDEEGQDIDAEIMSVLAQLGHAGEQTLLRRLRSGREQVRRRAVAALGGGSSAAGLEALSQALKDDSPQVRVAALEALEKRAGRRFLPKILDLYRDLDAEVRQAAIRVGMRLAAAGGAEAPDIQALLPLLGDKDPKVRASALLGMDRAHLGEGLIDQVREALKDPEPDVAAVACSLLGRHDSEEHFQTVLSMAEDAAADPKLRRAAMRAVGARGRWNEAIASLMAKTLSQAKSPVRLTAMDALLNLHRAGAAGSEQELPVSGQPNMGEIERTPSPLDLIIATLAGDALRRAEGDESPEPRSATVDDAPADRDYEIPLEVSPSLHETRAAKSSLEAIAIDNAEVALALEESENEGQATDIEIDQETAEYLALTEANEATARWLFTRDSLEADLDVRRIAARILGSAAAEPAVFALSQTLTSQDSALRREAAASLAAIADRFPQSRALAEAVDVLLEAAAADDRDLRVACLHALAKLNNSRASECLVAALDDKEPTVRIEAIRGLGGIERRKLSALTRDAPAPVESYLPRVARKLGDPEPGVRIAAARALAGMMRSRNRGSSEVSKAVEALVRAAFAGTGDQAREIGRALREIAPDLATGRLLEALRSLETSAERRVVIEMLEEIHRVQEPDAVGSTQGYRS